MLKLSFSKTEQEFLLKLARRSIEYFLENKKFLDLDLHELFSEKFFEKRATFITLEKFGTLRGCIGHVEAYHPLYFDIIENAVHSAFFDPRFRPMEKSELSQVLIEISVLTPLNKLHFHSQFELLKQITPQKHGVLIRKGNKSATYLPQVWKEIKNKEKFLSHLCLKAGLPSFSWQEKDIEIYTYEVESFKEK